MPASSTEPIADDRPLHEDDPIDIRIHVPRDDPELVRRSKDRKYGRLRRMNILALILCIVSVLGCLFSGIGLGNAVWYGADSGSPTEERSWGPLRRCDSSHDCKFIKFEEIKMTDTCVKSGSDVMSRMLPILILGFLQAAASVIAMVSALVINCRPTRSTALKAAGIISLLGSCCGGGCILLFSITVGDWWHCGSTFCGTTTATPCSEGNRYGVYLYATGVAELFVTAIICFALRSIHNGAFSTARAEIAAERELLAMAKIRAERRKARLEYESTLTTRARSLSSSPQRARMRAASIKVTGAAAHGSHPDDVEEDDEAEPIRPNFAIAGAEDWVFDERSKFYYSFDLNMFWDAATQKYFDVDTNEWRDKPN